MQVAFFGSSLVSAYWNGAATYYRGIIRALSERGFETTFYEPDAFERQEHRDIDDPDWARVVVYPATREGVLRSVERARGADLVVKASGVGVFDELLEEAVLDLSKPGTRVVFWDVDAPATLSRMRENENDPFRALVGQYDLVFTYGGGPPVVRTYEELGARRCVPIYNALDTRTHHPVAPRPDYDAALGFLGNRLPDREARVESFFLDAAARLPKHRFLLGGSGWQDKAMPSNVHYVGHVYTADHNAFNVSPKAVLNISRESMAQFGFSPATRVFEAAGAGACLITDAWEGIERFLEPDSEVLVARDGDDVARHVMELDSKRARTIGERARARLLREHTYAHRALDVERALDGESRLRRLAPRSHDHSSGAPQRRARPDPGRQSGLQIVVFGLSITSSWGNGHATTYRALLRELAARGHDILFLERDVSWYADHRDMPHPSFCRVALYQSLADAQARFSQEIASADMVIVGSYVPDGSALGRWICDAARGVTAFYDVDTPVTLARVAAGDCTYLDRELIARYDRYLSFAGGTTLTRLEKEFGSPRALPLYCSVDTELYRPSAESLAWDLGYMGTYSEDRQPALESLLLEPARQLASSRFIVAGPQFPESIAWPKNVQRIDHLPPAEHPSFYNRQRLTLNVTRRDMIAAGHSPSVRLFEAAACGTPIVSDFWEGLGDFFEIGNEILVARDPEDVVQALCRPASELEAIGERARQRVLAEHTAAHRAETLERYALEALEATSLPRTRTG